MLNVKFVLLCSIRTSFLSFHKIIRCFLFCFVFFNLARSTIYFIWRFKHLPLRRLKYIKVEYLYVGICLSCPVHRPLFTQVNVILFIAVFFPSLLCPFLVSSPANNTRMNVAGRSTMPQHYCQRPQDA